MLDQAARRALPLIERYLAERPRNYDLRSVDLSLQDSLHCFQCRPAAILPISAAVRRPVTYLLSLMPVIFLNFPIISSEEDNNSFPLV